MIGESEWQELRQVLPDVAESTLRSSGLPSGSRGAESTPHSLGNLDRDLREYSAIYATRHDLRRYCRRSGDRRQRPRARWVTERAHATSTRELNREMLQWMMVWLGDPAMFPAWANAGLLQIRQIETLRNEMAENVLNDPA